MTLTKIEEIGLRVQKDLDKMPVVATPPVEATQTAHKTAAIASLGGLKAYNEFTLDRYDNKAAIAKCEGFPKVNLYIWGKSGTGKTHLATALVRDSQWYTIVKPSHIFRQLRGKDGDQEQEVINKYAKMGILVIDDLGAEKSTEFNISMLYEIIDQRDMNYVKGLIITSNLSLGMLSEKLGDDRICSRLAGMCRVVELGGEDRRIA